MELWSRSTSRSCTPGWSSTFERVIVRDARPRDIDAVARIKVANWAESYGELVPRQTLQRFLDLDAQRAELLRKQSGEHTVLLVAEDEGVDHRIAGFALAFLDERPDPWLESLHVAHDARGHGVGTLLMRELARRFAARGFNTMRLGVVTGNDGAGRLYRRLGAQLIGEEPAHWAAGVTHEIYRWADLGSLTG